MVGYQPQGDKANFFRMVISNPAATQSDIDFLIEEIERLGQDLWCPFAEPESPAMLLPLRRPRTQLCQ